MVVGLDVSELCALWTVGEGVVGYIYQWEVCWRSIVVTGYANWYLYFGTIPMEVTSQKVEEMIWSRDKK
jgi:hypothetical protein